MKGNKKVSKRLYFKNKKPQMQTVHPLKRERMFTSLPFFYRSSMRLGYHTFLMVIKQRVV